MILFQIRELLLRRKHTETGSHQSDRHSLHHQSFGHSRKVQHCALVVESGQRSGTTCHCKFDVSEFSQFVMSSKTNQFVACVCLAL